MLLKDKEFLGIVLDNTDSNNLDNKRKGRYKVHIPEIMGHIDPGKGIWVKNHSHKWRISSSRYGEYGQYFPIQPDTKVIIKFHENDPNTGFIDRIVSDFRDNTDTLAQDCVEEKSELKDRDDQYIIFKTPKMWNIFYVNEETNKEPNTIYLIYNRDKESKYTNRQSEKTKNRRTVFRIDETGVQFWTADNNRVRIKLDDNKQVDGNQTEYIIGNSTKHVDKDFDLHVHKDKRINVDNDDDLWVRGNKTTNIDKDSLEHIKQEMRTLIDQDNHTIINSNRLTLIKSDDDIHINGNKTETVDGEYNSTINSNSTLNISGNTNTQISSNLILEVSGTCNLSVNGTCNIKSNASVNINGGPMINLNCSPVVPFLNSKKSRKVKDAEYPKDSPTSKTQMSYEETKSDPSVSEIKDGNHRFNKNWTNDGFKHADFAKAKTSVRDLGPDETTEYNEDDDYSGDDMDKGERKKTVGKKCDDVTDNYNNSHRESLDGKQYSEE